ncbi:MAG TPA: hypothetical protein VGT03_07645, partial [Candidatus Acidoferrales bacterium]|nr:hypothetical protein [Candidatus Acidoferrales bacterium]
VSGADQLLAESLLQRRRASRNFEFRLAFSFRAQLPQVIFSAEFHRSEAGKLYFQRAQGDTAQNWE